MMGASVYNGGSTITPNGGAEFVIDSANNATQFDIINYNGASWSQPMFMVSSAGNVGIGTWITKGALDIKTGNNVLVESGNVGIGSIAPGQLLDVLGTVRTTALAMTGQTPISGYVLTASDSAGDTTWTSAGTVAGWTVSGNGVYETLSGNVGIGTTALQTALAITNGNVGIGTWTAAGGSLIVATGNVGIGSAWPGQALDIAGGLRLKNNLILGGTTGGTVTAVGINDFAGGYSFNGGTSASINSGGTGSIAFGTSLSYF